VHSYKFAKAHEKFQKLEIMTLIKENTFTNGIKIFSIVCKFLEIVISKAHEELLRVI